MTIAQIQQHTNAQILQMPFPAQSVSELMLDTRHLPLPGAVFFAIVGQRHDGHHYLADAWQAGVRQFVVSQAINLPQLPDSNVLLVGDTLRALQQTAAAHRARFDIPVVGITGSNGKTIVKEWLYQILAPSFQVIRSPKSYNSQVGVPLSVWEMRTEHQIALFEAGISQPDEMAFLEKMIQPKIGIFTNLGTAHSDGFHSDSEKAAEKMLLFRHAQALVYCADHLRVAEQVAKLKQKKPDLALFSWSKEDNEALIRVKTNIGTRICTCIATYNSQEWTLQIPFTDTASVENALHCFAAGLALGVDPNVLVIGLSRLYPIGMRLELKTGVEQSTLVNDFYNNDLSSLQILLQFARQQSGNKKKTLILSDILQSGQTPELLYKKVALVLKGIERFIGIGTEITAIQPFLPAKTEVHFYADTASFLGDIQRFSWRNSLVLLKGARPFEFEKISKRLEQKAHQTRLEINLNALIHNLKTYNDLLKPGVKTMAMVKAAAYGSGGAEVARLLEFHKVGYLGVAYVDEGIELRQAGVQLPILVLNPDTAGFDVFYRFQLEPEIYSLQILEELVEYTGTEKVMRVHLKLDTGMHRLGFESSDIATLTAILRQFPNIKIASVFTHLSASDNPDFDAFTHSQAALFIAMYQQIEQVLDYKPLRHVVNTGGISRFPQYHFDMVRLGIGLYGIDGTGVQKQLQVVNVLKTTVSQVKNIPAGDTVGYNRNSGLLQKPVTTATISIGYADGFLRAAGGGRYKVLINNELVPTIGNICMDMTMLDVSHVPGVKAGDEVIIFGKKPPVEDLAKCMNTIPYEIFTNISDRVKRVYVQE